MLRLARGLALTLALVALYGTYVVVDRLERRWALEDEQSYLVAELAWTQQARDTLAALLPVSREVFAETCRAFGFPDLRHCRRMADQLRRRR